MKHIRGRLGTAAGWVAISSAAFSLGCVDGDNPAALAELEPVVEFDIEATVPETYREIEVTVEVTESGARMELSDAQMIVQNGSAIQTYDLEEDEDGLGAHVMFYEDGPHELEIWGTPMRHRLSMEIGHMEIEVSRRHEIAGPYWVEFATDPAPIEHDHTAHLEVFVFDLLADGSRGGSVTSLTVTGELHHPDGHESLIDMIEGEAGEYEAEFEFAEVGAWELHAEIDDGSDEYSAEFHFPVIDPDEPGDQDPGDPGNGGGGHGHG